MSGMDFFVKLTHDGWVAVEREGSLAYNVELYVKADHPPSKGDRGANFHLVFGDKIPAPDPSVASSAPPAGKVQP